MKQQALSIHISNPCTESWDGMTPLGLGRHCSSCAKTVTDFSRMSDAQIVSVLSSGQSSSCGRFQKQQLDRLLTIPTPVEEGPKLLPWLAALLLTGSAGSVWGQETADSVKPLEQSEETNLSLIDSLQTKVDSLPELRFFGRVLNQSDLEALEGIKIRLVGTKLKTTSSKNGYFSLHIPADIVNDTFEFRFRYEQERFTFRFTRAELEQQQQIKLDAYSLCLLTGDIMVSGSFTPEYHKPPIDELISEFWKDTVQRQVDQRPIFSSKQNLERPGTKWWYAGFIQAILPSRRKRKER